MSAQVEPCEAVTGPSEKATAETPSAACQTGTPGGEALCLEVPIRVIGTRAPADPGGELSADSHFEEESVTMLLLPRGAVIRLAAPVATGQDLMLINTWTNKHVHCRVANIRTSPEVKRYVDIEFSHAAPNFWGTSYPKEAAKAGAAECAPEAPAEPNVESLWVVPKKARAAAAGAVPAISAAVVPALATERAAAIPADAPTSLPEPDGFSSPEPFFRPLPTERLPLCEPVLAQMEVVPASPPPAKWDPLIEPAPRSSGARRAMAATAVLCAIFLGYRIYSAGEQLPLTAPQGDSPPGGDSSQGAATAIPAPAFAGAATETKSDAPATKVESAETSAAGLSAGVGAVTALAPEVPRVESPRRLVLPTSKMVMPVREIASDANEAPEVTPSAGAEPAPATGVLFETGAVLPPPPPPVTMPEKTENPAAPLTPAQVVASVPPIYPLLAKQAHIEGNVTIEARLDASGKVASMKVLSGPVALREAATDAVAKWKFQPAQLGDQRTPISVVLTIRFVLR